MLLHIENLHISFGDTKAVKGISFVVEQGKTTALVGESGSGKTVSALSILKLINADITGKIELEGIDMLTASKQTLQQMRGTSAAVIFQEPMTSLNPLHTIGNQVAEVLQIHQNISKKQAYAKSVHLLQEAGLTNAKDRINAYPHQLSGGQRQRVMIAMALAGNPKLLIADEPTTALDVTTQANIISLLIKLQKKFGMAILFISHNLGLVKSIADYVYVMKDGKIVEEGKTKAILTRPENPYTIKLINSYAKGMAKASVRSVPALLQGKKITVKYGNFKAVDNVSFTVKKGQCLGIIGESGSGKTSLGMAILRLLNKAVVTGEVTYGDNLITAANIKHFRQNMQIVFQDPYSSLNPRMTIEQIVGEGLEIYFPKLPKQDRHEKIAAILGKVGLPQTVLSHYPHEFSGGQRQRIALARAIILNPDFIILDEPTSALDVTVASQIIELLKDLKKEMGLSYMLITHDISVIKAVAEDVMVLKDGKIVEYNTNRNILMYPKNPYTKKLISSALIGEIKK